jgi:osmotically-inducible protein OsmY
MLVGAVLAGSACTQKSEDEAKDEAASIAEETKDVAGEVAGDSKNIAQKVGDKAKELAGETADKTKEIAGAVGSKTKDVVLTTGEAITDGWITTKVSAKFVDEKLLKGSNINVDTKDHVVTLKGTVGSDAAKARAVEIAGNTEGVVRVVNQLIVK